MIRAIEVDPGKRYIGDVLKMKEGEKKGENEKKKDAFCNRAGLIRCSTSEKQKLSATAVRERELCYRRRRTAKPTT